MYALKVGILVLHRKLRQFPLTQQSVFVFACLLISQLLLFWFENLKAPAQLHATFWLPVFIGMLSWCAVYHVVRFVRRL